MANKIDSKMSSDKQNLAKKILTELNLDKMTVTFDEKIQEFEFVLDRRTVSVPLKLAQGEVDEAVRYLFRAVLMSPNAKWNRAADGNDWSTKNPYK